MSRRRNHILRESDTRRLVFKPMLVDQPEAPVRGCFVWQRKKKADHWEDITGESLTALRSGEGYSLELRSGEVAALIEGLEARKELYAEFGIAPGQHDYLAGAGLPDLVRRWSRNRILSLQTRCASSTPTTCSTSVERSTSPRWTSSSASGTPMRQ